MTDIFHQLKRPFPPNRVKWRVGQTNRDKTRGLALAYVDARDVYARFDDVVGPGAWQCRYPLADSGLLICEIGLHLPTFDNENNFAGMEWVWKSNGAGDTSYEAEKGKCSDAFKRAGVAWGVARYLYSLPSKWVALDDNQRIPSTEIPAMPEWALPEGFDKIMAERNAA